jgi:hypothetical protein
MTVECWLTNNKGSATEIPKIRIIEAFEFSIDLGTVLQFPS